MYFEKRAATNDARSSPDSGHSRANTAKGSSRFDDGCSDLTQSALQLLFDEIHRRRIDPIAVLLAPVLREGAAVLKSHHDQIRQSAARHIEAIIRRARDRIVAGKKIDFAVKIRAQGLQGHARDELHRVGCIEVAVDALVAL